MELAIREAKTRFSELFVASRNGEHVITARRGRPIVELMRRDLRNGIDFGKLKTLRDCLGTKRDGEGRS